MQSIGFAYVFGGGALIGVAYAPVWKAKVPQGFIAPLCCMKFDFG